MSVVTGGSRAFGEQLQGELNSNCYDTSLMLAMNIFGFLRKLLNIF